MSAPSPVDSIEIILRILSYLKGERRGPKKKLDILTRCRLTDEQFEKYMFKGAGSYGALVNLELVRVLPPPEGDKRVKGLFAITDNGLQCLEKMSMALISFFNPKQVESYAELTV